MRPQCRRHEEHECAGARHRLRLREHAEREHLRAGANTMSPPASRARVERLLARSRPGRPRAPARERDQLAEVADDDADGPADPEQEHGSHRGTPAGDRAACCRESDHRRLVHEDEPDRDVRDRPLADAGLPGAGDAEEDARRRREGGRHREHTHGKDEIRSATTPATKIQSPSASASSGSGRVRRGAAAANPSIGTSVRPTAAISIVSQPTSASARWMSNSRS